jgi:peroxiredoxin
MPSICLEQITGTRFSLDEVGLSWVAFYLYPGTHTPPALGGDSPAEDAAQHLAYRSRQERFEELSLTVVGISSESDAEQYETICEHRIGHLMLIDPALTLAEALGLPTFELADRRWYRRLTLLTRSGVIERVFPVSRGASNPGQVLTWLQLHS